MSHPNVAELTDYLYGELPPARQAEVTRHVEACAECRQRIEGWRDTRTNLAAWKLPAASTSLLMPLGARRRMGALRWAAAAAVLLASGYGVARLTTRPVDLASLRTELAREVRQEVRQELTTELARHAERQSSEQRHFQDAVVATMSKLENRRVVEHTSLRKDVETVAVLAEQRFARLASFDAEMPPQSQQ